MLPIVLDVGTSNPQRLADPMAMGWHHPRITGADYDAFVEGIHPSGSTPVWAYSSSVRRFRTKHNAIAWALQRSHLLFQRWYQGTAAAVTVGSLLAACKAANTKLSNQRIATFLGAGSAGCGIAEAIIAQMVSEGISDAQARSQVYMVDRGVCCREGMQNLWFPTALACKPTRTPKLGKATVQVSLYSTLFVMLNQPYWIWCINAPGLFRQRSHQRDEPSLWTSYRIPTIQTQQAVLKQHQTTLFVGLMVKHLLRQVTRLSR